MSKLNDLVVIITGAGTGLGKDLALLFAKEGANVVGCGRRKEKIQQLERELQAYPGQVLALSADVSQEQEVKSLVDKAVSRFGRIDVLINNAAVFENSSILETSLESWNYHFQNNVTSTFLMTRECIPVMRKQRSGQIINFTSGLAKTGANGFGAYSASKAAIEAFTYSIDEEERRNGIHAHVINPGVMKTNMQAIGTDPKRVAGKLIRFVTEAPVPEGKVIQLDELDMEFHI